MAGIVIFGSTFFVKNRDASQYTTGGGKLPSFIVGMSIFATFVSSISFLAIPGKAYQSDWNAFVFSLSIPVAAILAVKFFIPLYRSVNSISAYTFLEKRFGLWARTYASLCYILTQLMRVGSILYLMALPLNAMFNWNISIIIVLTGLSVILYSMLGGIKAVVWTDAIQGLILIGGALTCAFLLLFSMPEDPGQLFRIAMEHHKFSLGDFGPGISQSTFWVMLLYGLFINLQNYGIDQNYIQRYMLTETERGAKRSALFGALLYVPVSLVFFFIGTALFSYYTASPDLLPAELRDISQGDKIFPYFIVRELPPGLTGVLIASVFAAGMSTVSTSINGTATIIHTDYFLRFFNKGQADGKGMRVLYLASLIFGFFGIIIALAMIKVKSALDVWWMLASIFSGGMLGLFLLALISRRAQRAGAVIGVVAGILVIFWLSLSPIYFTEGALLKFRSPFHANLTIVIGTTVIFLVGFLFTLILNRHGRRGA
ncbi:MAG: sodium:solute symporter [Bacteroidales bacterium]|nr:sodium:solute symporter [Bacteroidales bacterium]MBN2698280.1 sodium:solute symporter [Bacteroidales bacterium]